MAAEFSLAACSLSTSLSRPLFSPVPRILSAAALRFWSPEGRIHRSWERIVLSSLSPRGQSVILLMHRLML